MVRRRDSGERGLNCALDGGGNRTRHGALPCDQIREVGHLCVDVGCPVDHAWFSRWLVVGVYSDGLGCGCSGRCDFVYLVRQVHPDGSPTYGIGQTALTSTVRAVNVPAHLKYTKDHEWVLLNGSIARVGITDYAQDALGDIVYIQLPDQGSAVELHQGLGEIESTKSVNDVYAPVSGTVVTINDALSATPELLNSDPYGDGWICEIEVSTLNEAGLMSAEEYSALIGA